MTAPRISALGTRRNIALLGLLAIVFSFYLWTATSSANPVRFGQNQSDYYNLFSDALLAGQLDLLVKPAPELLALENPYDPATNAPYRLHDMSLYNGKYFMPWGPAPALTLFIPFRLLPGDLPENLAVVIYSFVGLVFSILLFRLLLRRLLPRSPAWVEFVGAVALAFGNAAPFILRRPSVYEVAITSGYCFMFAGLYFLCSAAIAERSALKRLAAGSLCLGLAVGSRPNLGLVAVFALAAIWLYLTRRGTPVAGGKLHAGTALAGPFLVCMTLLLLYNLARFDSPTDFGYTHQLAGTEQRLKDFFNVAYLAPGLYSYLVAPARLGLDFPYFHLPPPPGYPGKLPSGYDGIEVTGGVLTNLPICLLLVALPLVGLARGLRTGREVGVVIACLALPGLLVAGILSYSLWGTTMRYEMDFATFFILAAMLAWALLLWWTRGSPAGYRALAAGGIALVVYGALIGVAISMTGYYDSLRTGSPGQYRALERFFSPLPTFATMIIGRPILVDVFNDTGYSAPVTYGTAGAGAASFWISRNPTLIKVVSPRDGRVLLVAGVRRGPSARPRSRLVLVAAPEGEESAARLVQDRLEHIPVRLKRGLNEITLKVVETPAPKTPPAAQPEQLAAVEGLHVTTAG